MTITNTTVKQRYTGNGATVDFAIPFSFMDEDEILVYLRDETDASNITETLKTLTTHYTLGGGNPVTTVTMVTAPSATQKVVIKRSTVKTQATDYDEDDGFPADSHEDALDKLTQIVQELNEMFERVLILPVSTAVSDSELEAEEAYAYIRWNSAASAFENSVFIATSPLSWSPATSTFSMTQANGSQAGYLSAADWTTFNDKQIAGSPSVSATELGYLDGATSNIQAQINAIVAASAVFAVYGTYGSPQAITAGGGISAGSDQRQIRYVVGSGGAVDVSANPQIAAGVTEGQEMRVIGTDDTNTVTLEHGTGLILNGTCVLRAGSLIDLSWSAGASAWIEAGRNGI